MENINLYYSIKDGEEVSNLFFLNNYANDETFKKKERDYSDFKNFFK